MLIKPTVNNLKDCPRTIIDLVPSDSAACETQEEANDVAVRGMGDGTCHQTPALPKFISFEMTRNTPICINGMGIPFLILRQ
jgi:hypothetical protein